MIEQPSPVAVVALLRDALDGDATRIEELRKTTPRQLQAAGVELGGELSFGRPTVLRVLHDWRAGRINDGQVRWWALLMFTGGFPVDWTPYGGHFPGRPIHVDYSDDEEVNEVVFDLKDVGDFDDVGHIRRNIDEMIAKLAD